MTSETDKELLLRVAHGLESGCGANLWLTDTEMRTISRVLREAAEGGWRPISVTPELVRYIAQYGGRCRDCADTIMRPVCEGTGMPCGGADGAVRHVLSAINYGFAHGFLNPPPPPSPEPATHSLEPRNDD